MKGARRLGHSSEIAAFQLRTEALPIPSVHRGGIGVLEYVANRQTCGDQCGRTVLRLGFTELLVPGCHQRAGPATQLARPALCRLRGQYQRLNFKLWSLINQIVGSLSTRA